VCLEGSLVVLGIPLNNELHGLGLILDKSNWLENGEIGNTNSVVGQLTKCITCALHSEANVEDERHDHCVEHNVVFQDRCGSRCKVRDVHVT
jgi:hypothetical protein